MIHSATPESAIELLNEALTSDPEAMEVLFEVRIFCNEELANHPTIQVMDVQKSDGSPAYKVGLLGLLNGIFGVDERGIGAISAVYDDTGDLVEFKRS